MGGDGHSIAAETWVMIIKHDGNYFPKNQPKAIDLFTNIFKCNRMFFSWRSSDMVLMNELQYLEFSLRVLLFALSNKPRATSRVLKNNFYLKSVHNTWICWWTVLFQGPYTLSSEICQHYTDVLRNPNIMVRQYGIDIYSPTVLLVATCSLYIENFPNRCLLVPHDPLFLILVESWFNEIATCQRPCCVV